MEWLRVGPDDVAYGTPARIGERPATVVRVDRGQYGVILAVTLRDEVTADEVQFAWREKYVAPHYMWEPSAYATATLIRTFPGPPARMLSVDGLACVVGER